MKLTLLLIAVATLATSLQAADTRDIVVDAQTNAISIDPSQYPGGDPIWLFDLSSESYRIYITENTTHWYPGSPNYGQVCIYLQRVHSLNGVPVNTDLIQTTLAEGDTLEVVYDPLPGGSPGQIGAYFVDSGNQDNSGQLTLRAESLDFDGCTDSFAELDWSFWGSFGTPLPSIDPTRGTPAPSLMGNGDNNSSEGIYTLGSYAPIGLDVEVSMLNDADGPTAGARCGVWITETHDAWNDQDPFGDDWSALIHLNPWDENSTRLGVQGGGLDSEILPFEHDDQWHRWRIRINEDLTVSFFRDGEEMHRTLETMPITVETVQVVLVTGSRSWHDEICIDPGQAGCPPGEYVGTYDRFDTLGPSWYFIGSPDPTIDASDGTPAPALRGQGDNNFTELLVSVFEAPMGPQYFEVSMRNDAVGPTAGARCGFWISEARGTWDDGDPFGDYWAAMVHLNPWDSSTTRLGMQGGGIDPEIVPFAHDDQWHRWRIEIHDDRTVSFYRDCMLLYRTTTPVPESIDALQMALVTGTRSWHDEATFELSPSSIGDQPPSEFVSELVISPQPARSWPIRIAYSKPIMEGDGEISIFDTSGRKIRDLPLGESGDLSAVYWDGRSDRGGQVDSGIYFARVKVGRRVVAKSKIVYVD